VWAVGEATPSGGQSKTWIERWDGVSWTRVTSPNRGTKGNILYSVSANASNDVWAVGESDASTSNPHTLIEHWDGATWSIVSSPNPGSTGAVLNGVKADTTGSAWAVGAEHLGPAIMEHWDGVSWTVQSIPHPAGSDVLQAVGGAGSDLFAAGWYGDSAGVIRTLVLHCC
jgi:hypothetical protein